MVSISVWIRNVPDLLAWSQTVSETQNIRIRKGLKDYFVQVHVFTDKETEVQRGQMTCCHSTWQALFWNTCFMPVFPQDLKLQESSSQLPCSWSISRLNTRPDMLPASLNIYLLSVLPIRLPCPWEQGLCLLLLTTLPPKPSTGPGTCWGLLQICWVNEWLKE